MKFTHQSTDHSLSIRSDLPITPEFISGIRAAVRVNKKLFEFAPKRISVVVCNNRKSWKIESKYYHFPFARGLVLRDGTIVLKSRRFSGLTPVAYRRLIVHECNHLFWLRNTAGGRSMWSPIWLVEALACDAARGEYLLSRSQLRAAFSGEIPNQLLPYRYRNSEVSTRSELIKKYSLWFHFYRSLIGMEAFSLSSLLDTIRRENSKSSVDRWFRTRFGVTPEILARRFVFAEIGT